MQGQRSLRASVYVVTYHSLRRLGGYNFLPRLSLGSFVRAIFRFLKEYKVVSPSCTNNRHSNMVTFRP